MPTSRRGQPYLVVDWPRALSGPSAPGFTVLPGNSPGEVNLTIHTPPLTAGDGPVAGDGRGVITGYASSINGVIVQHGPTLPIQRAVTGLPPLSTVAVLVWAYGFGGSITGRIGTQVGDVVIAPGVPIGPVGPSVPAWALVTGDATGEVRLSITAPPASLGDGPTGGDGLGLVTDYETSIAGGPLISRGATLPITVVSGGHTPGALVSAVVRTRGYEGRIGASGTASAAARVAPVTPVGPTAVGVTGGPGPNPGSIRIEITAPPSSVGDGPVGGDGAGIITDYRIGVGAGALISRGTALPIVVISEGHPEGELVPFTAQALGYGGRPGAVSSGSAYPMVTPVAPRAPSAPGFAAGPTSEAGQINVLIHTAPGFLGDGAAFGDGLGAITGYVTSINGVDVTHGPGLPVSRSVSDLTVGVPVPIVIWALGYAGRAGTAVSTTATALGVPAGPNLPTWATLTGLNPGEVMVQITAPSSDPGDGVLAGDDLGVVTDYEISINNGPLISQGTVLPITVTFGGYPEGATIASGIRVRGYGGRIGAVATGSAAAAVTPLAPRAPTAPGFTAGPGAQPGWINVLIDTAPSFIGDGPLHSDGLGAIVSYEASVNGGPFTGRGATLPISFNASGFPEGALIPVSVRAIGYGGRVGEVISTTAMATITPGLPTTPGADYGSGQEPGQVRIEIHSPPASLGDGPVYGDGLGVITGYVTRIGDVTYTHGAVLPISRLSSGHTEGVEVAMEWWALGYNGRPGLSGTAWVMPAVSPPYSLAGLVEEMSGYGLIDATTGRGLAVRGELPAWGPSVPGADFGPDDDAGEVFIEIHTAPTVQGSEPDDNVQSYVTRINGVTVTHNTTVLPIRRVVTGLPQGVPVEIRWWALGEQNRPGLIGVTSVFPRAAAATETIGLVDVTTGHGLVDQTTGHGLVLSIED